MYENLGKKLKHLRQKKQMTLKDLSEKTNLSISFLSQVERSKSSVTLASLRRISEALGATPNSLLTSKDEYHPSIMRSTEGEEHSSENLHFLYKNLSGDVPDPVFEPIIATLLPGEKDNTPYGHKGQEFLYVLEGVLSVILENKKYYLYAGDSLHIDSSTIHVWYNDTEKPIKLLLIHSVNTD